jgi:magnesium transporter
MKSAIEHDDELDAFIEKIRGWIGERDREALLDFMGRIPPPDLADLLVTMRVQEGLLLWRILPKEKAAEVFSHLDSNQKDTLISALSDEEIRAFLAGMEPDDRTDFFEDLPGEAVQRMINLIDPRQRQQTLEFLGYPEESVGRLMTPRYVAVRPDWTIGQALDHIRRKGAESETVNTIFATDRNWQLLDTVELRQIILAEPQTRVDDLMDYSVISISVLEDREEAVALIQRYDLEVLPVVDADGILLGIVTWDDVFDVAEEEFTEDFHLAGAVAPLRTSYREASAWSLYNRRVVWLLVLLAINFFSTGIVAGNEELISSMVALSFFIPLLIASGGNTGAQSATLMIRALSTGELELREWLWALWRELKIGLLLGATLGLVASLLGLIRGGVALSAVILIAMTLIILISNLTGVVLPILLTKFGRDPAVASSPLVTSIADVLGLLIYFGVAAAVLK